MFTTSFPSINKNTTRPSVGSFSSTFSSIVFLTNSTHDIINLKLTDGLFPSWLLIHSLNSQAKAFNFPFLRMKKNTRAYLYFVFGKQYLSAKETQDKIFFPLFLAVGDHIVKKLLKLMYSWRIDDGATQTNEGGTMKMWKLNGHTVRSARPKKSCIQITFNSVWRKTEILNEDISISISP